MKHPDPYLEVLHEAQQGQFAELAHYADSDVDSLLNRIARIEDTDGHNWKYWQSVYDGQLLDQGADCLKCGISLDQLMHFPDAEFCTGATPL